MASNNRTVPDGGKASRGVDLVSVDDLDDDEVASWMHQATAMPGFGGRKR